MVEDKKSSMPLLTVLMPVYNAEKFLAESIDSILNQTYVDFEMLILDDASTDNSLKIIKAYAKEDKRIKILVNKTNQRQAKCRNSLLKKTKTEFIAWMDADDISSSHWLQTQMDFLKKNPKIDVVSCHLKFFENLEFILKRPLLDLQIKSAFLLDCAFGTGGSMMKMKKIRANKLFFNEQLESAEDYDYWIKSCSVLSFAAVDEVLYNYRIHNIQESKTNKEKQRKAHLLCSQKHLLQFNIKTDSETIRIFLNWDIKEVDSKKFQEAVNVLDKVFSLKNFYGYSGVNKPTLIFYYLNLVKGLLYRRLLKKNLKKVKKFLKNIPEEYSAITPSFILNEIYYQYKKIGLKGELLFIKDFGFLDDFKPFLTVLMPVYNAEKFLKDSIGSILKQTYSDFELLILDDGSTDNSLKIIEAYAKEDKRIKVIVNQKNRGEAKCRNRLLKNSKTEFIAWMDADDISLEDRLQTQMDFLKQNPKIDAVGVQYSAFGSSGNLATNFTSRCSLSDLEIKTNFIFGYDFFFPSSLMRIKKIKLHHLFFDIHYKLSTGVDQQYIIDCFPFMKFANIDRVLYQYRQHAHQIMKVNQKQILDNSSVIIRKHLLSFNIKTDLETIKMFLNWNDEGVDSQASQKFQEAVRVFKEIFSIKDFYGYSGVKKSFLIHCFYNLLSYCVEFVKKKSGNYF